MLMRLYVLSGLGPDKRSTQQEELVSDSATRLTLLSMRGQMAASRGLADAAKQSQGVCIEQREDQEAGPSAGIPLGGSMWLSYMGLLCMLWMTQLVWAAQLLHAFSWMSTFTKSICILSHSYLMLMHIVDLPFSSLFQGML